MFNIRDKYEILGFIFILLIIAIIFIAMFNKKGYEYYIGTTIGKSDDCYQTNKTDCFCKTPNGYIKVDGYYVAE